MIRLTRRGDRLLLYAAVLVLLAWVAPAWAAEAAGGGEVKSAPESLLELVLAGGWLNLVFLGVLGVFSLVAATVVIERLVNLTPRKALPPGFAGGLAELTGRREDDPGPFRELCRRFPSPAAAILNAGLLRAGRPLPEVEKAMEDAAAREFAALRARIRPLSVLAGVAPLVGLLGTVVGMILAFRTASQAGLGKAELLAEGIYLALETTVAGLAIAIPAQLFAAYFHGRTEKVMRRIDEQLGETIPCFTLMEQAEPDRLAAAGR